MNAEVSRAFAEALFRQLSGFQGYPAKGPGEEYFIDAFQMACISIEHAEAVIAAFDGTMPTIREIRETANNLKPKFLPSLESDRARWERECGPPKPFDQTIALPKERRDDEIWRKLRDKYPRAQRWPSWAQLAKDARELGYEDYARAWENSYI